MQNGYFAVAMRVILLIALCSNHVASAEEQHSTDFVAEGLRYLRGDGVPKDNRKAAYFFQLGCDAHIAQACWCLGLQYSVGDPFPKDEKHAVTLFEVACAGNVADACQLLGDLYMQGTVVSKDEPQAANLYARACSGGNLIGCFGLAILTANGIGVAKDLPKAAQLYEQACRGGHGKACYNLAFVYRDGQGVERDELRSVRLFTAACTLGEVLACSYLGSVYGVGLHGSAIDEPLSVKYFTLACDGGVAAACAILGRKYADGVGVAQNWEKAVALYTSACGSGEADACNSLALCYEKGTGTKKGIVRAIEIYDHACSIGSIEACYNLGLLYDRGTDVRRDSEAASKLYEKACTAGDAPACNALGLLTEALNDLAAALTLYRRACDGGSAEGCFNAGLLYSNPGTPARNDVAAAPLFERSCDLKDAHGCAWASGFYFVNGEFPKAERYASAYVAIEEQEAPKSEELAKALDQLGHILMLRGQIPEADQTYRRALQIRRSIEPSNRGVAVSLVNVAGIAGMRADWPAATDLYRQALSVYSASSSFDQDYANAVGGAAAAMIRAGDWSSGRQLFSEAITRYESSAPNSYPLAALLVQFAIAAEEHDELDLAETSARKAWAIFKLYESVDILSPIALVAIARIAEHRGDLQTAEDLYAQVLDTHFLNSDESVIRADPLYRIGRILHHQCDLKKSAEYLDRAIDRLERQHTHLGGSLESGIRFNTQYEEIYKEKVLVLLEADDIDNAFRTTELYKARAFVQMLAEREVIAADVPEELQETTGSINAENDRLQAELNRIGTLSDSKRATEVRVRLRELAEAETSVRDAIRKSSPKFAALRYPEPLTALQTARVLDPGTVMLSYSVAAESITCFVLKNGGGPPVRTFVVPIHAAELRTKVSAFRQLIESESDLGRVGAAGSALYELLMRPAESDIANADRLLVSPDGPLHSLPFGALVSAGDATSSPVYLAAGKPIHLIASATLYKEVKEMRPSKPTTCVNLVAFGNPDYRALAYEVPVNSDADVAALRSRGVRFEPLPATKREVDAVAKLFPGTSRVFIGSEATETHARSITRDARFIHFACHGVLDAQFPFDSALVLSIPTKTSDNDNGLLQAREVIQSMRLDADLVTLSACNSAQGAELGGEGLLGLTRAFQYAGARSVLGSLWSVADESTAILMEAFYSALCKGQSKDEALRSAQAFMIHHETFGHPFFWAAFELTGDWR